MSNISPHQERKKWLIKAPLGLILIGFGTCLVAEAAMVKYSGAAFWDWFSYGTFALVVLNSGLCVLGDAVKHRGHYERLRAERA